MICHMTTCLRERLTPGFLAMVLLLVMVPSLTVRAQERMGPIPVDKQTDAQKKAIAEYKLTRPSGPFAFWWLYLRIPDITIPFLRIQEHVHSHTALDERLTHFAIMIAGREWSQNVIWMLHWDNALKSGLKESIMKDLAEGRRPRNMAEDEEVLYDFSIELQRNKGVSDPTYARAIEKLGEAGVANAVLIQGEYTLMSMVMNVQRTPLREGAKPLLPHLPIGNVTLVK